MNVPGLLARVLRASARRWRTLGGLKILLLALAAPASGLLALCLADNLLALPGLVRHGAALGLLAGAALLAARRAAPLLRPIPPEAAAWRLDRAHPENEGILVNAVLLARREPERPLVRLLLEQAEARARAASPARVAPWSGLARAARAAGAAAAAWILYAAALPGPALNAVQRLYLGDDEAPPLAALELAVTPGDCELLAGADLAVRAEVRAGALPGAAWFHVVRRGERAAFPMEFDGRGFRQVLPGVREPLAYHVEAGGARTRSFTVKVVTPPAPELITATLSFPPYSRLAPLVDAPIAGPLEALQGTRATLRFRFNLPLAEARIALPGSPPAPLEREDDRTWTASFRILQSGRYTLSLRDAQGRSDRGDLSYALRAREDLPPTVSIPLPGRDIFCAATTRVPLEVTAQDDVGLAAVELRAGTEAGERPAIAWEASGKAGRFAAAVVPAELGAEAGDVVHYYAVARDLKGATARSRLFTLTVRTGEDESRRLAAGLAALLERVRRILELQVAARGRNEALMARRVPRPEWRRETSALTAAQEEIRRETLGVLADWVDPVLVRAPARVLLERVAAREMADAVRAFLAAAGRGEPGGPELARAAGLQAVIEKILREVLASGEALAALIREQGPEAALVASGQRLRNATEPLKALAERLRELVADQERVVQATEAIRDARPQDLTAEERRGLESLAMTEEKWAGLLMEAWNDLSKLYPQDFSSSRLCTELLEAYSEVELAADALTRKAVTMAVPHEQAGLELAKSITENIERWLADVRDHQKWVMEEPPEEFEVPMADLPEELEDLIGDLIDAEEAMSEETEDVTSGWMDSLDEGAGWTAMDGPISNMSAKGVTGNLLPNANEVGGRSGEGRTAKSSGQMVEETAAGKGGRRTPTRYTPDPFEGGEVKDRSSDPTGGSTGGGKLSGANEQGLRGVPSPELQRRLDRLAGEQARVRQEAERLDHRLRSGRFAARDLAEAVRLMKAFEEGLLRGRPADYAARRREIADRLSAVQTLFAEQLRVQREGTLELPRRTRRETRSSQPEQPPAEYRPLVEEYFRALLEERR